MQLVPVVENSRLGVVHKLRLQQEWVGGFMKCQLNFLSLVSDLVWKGGSKKGKNV